MRAKPADTIDPLAGSYYVESLTDTIEQKAVEYIKKIDKMGGMVQAIYDGFPQREIQNASYEYQKEIESQTEIIVGMNKFKIKEKPLENLMKINEEVGRSQIGRLTNIKKRRNNNKVKQDLRMIREAAKDENINLMPFIVQAVTDYTSIGEISNTLRDLFGEYQEQVVSS